MKVRILLVDDHLMFREALCNLFNAQPNLEVVGQTGESLQVVPLARATAPHVVFMDINMPKVSGIEITRALLKDMPQVKVVALSAFSNQRYVKDMFNVGATGYVTKCEASDELLRALRAVMCGRTYLCPYASEVMTNTYLGASGRDFTAVVLGAREQQVLSLVTTGHTSIQIAKLMSIAPSTVDVHRRNIMRKLDRHSVAELTRYVVNTERGDSEFSHLATDVSHFA